MSENSGTGSRELQKIDIIPFLRDLLNSFKRLWIVVLALTVGAAALFYYNVSVNYTPVYVAEATVSVEVINGSATTNRNTAEQMGQIFPYLMSSGVLSDVVAADMGVKSVPGTVTGTHISGTNLLTIRASSGKAETAYELLQSVLRNYPDVALYVVGQTELTVIDDSGVPKDTGRTAVMRGSVRRGAIIGLALGLLIVIVRALLYRTVHNEEELRSILNVPALGTLPAVRKRVRRKGDRNEINILYDAGRGEYIEAMRMIRARIERNLKDSKVLMITSSVSGEGKSTVAANVAVSMAQREKKVLLIDCDLRSPSQGRIFNLKDEYPGLVSVLRKGSTLSGALAHIKHESITGALDILPGAGRSSEKVEALGSSEMKELLGSLRNQYDIVILDTPPSAVLVDAMMLLRHVDAVAYVVMAEYALRRYIFGGVEELVNGGANIIGCILNGGRTKSSARGYYSYRSSYRYGSYGYSKYGYSRYGYAKSGRSGSSSGKEKK